MGAESNLGYNFHRCAVVIFISVEVHHAGDVFRLHQVQEVSHRKNIARIF